jgi:kynurenine formamidase
VENLAGLKHIAGKTVYFSAAPLALSGRDGSPVRAYAVVEGSPRECARAG